MLDWNTLSLDKMVEHLENEFKFSSTGTAKCVNSLIEFYKNNKLQYIQNMCQCNKSETTLINGKYICSTCNKPLN